MTDGSSQGLFVIVAVVIFGIFVAISYVIFNDSLKPSLASIFEDSTKKSLTELKYPFKPLGNLKADHSIIENVQTVQEGSFSEINFDWKSFKPTTRYFIGFSTYDYVEIPWNHKIEISFDIMHNGDSSAWGYFDYNSFPEEGLNASWKGNDAYGNVYKDPDRKGNLIEPNTWGTVTGIYNNDNNLNLKKVSIFEGVKGNGSYGSIFGMYIEEVKNKNITNVKIKNVKYRVIPIK